MALFLKVNGETEDLGFYPDYTILHDKIDGYIEAVRFRKVFEYNGKKYSMMYVDDEGLLKNKIVNMTATLIAGQTIVGDVILFTVEEVRKDMEP